MSAFFVSKKTIDHAVMAAIPSAMSGDETGTVKGKILITMNIRALVARYPGIVDTQELADYMADLEAYEFEEDKTASEVQLLKSLNCWLYQCCEGTVDEEPDYKKLEKLSELMTEQLSKGRTKFSFGEQRPFVPGYDEAEWCA